jgi:hypothetical protein
MSEGKVISLRITPKRDGFTATVIGPRPANLGPRPVLVQRTEPTEYLAACAVLQALFAQEAAVEQ